MLAALASREFANRLPERFQVQQRETQYLISGVQLGGVMVLLGRLAPLLPGRVRG